MKPATRDRKESRSLATAIAVGLMAIALVSLRRDAFKPAWPGRAALAGLASGGLFGLSAVCYRAASLALDDGGFLIRAAFTLASAPCLLQTIVIAF